jgi:hypothetical protein
LAIDNLARMVRGTPQAIDAARLPFLARVRAAFKAPAQASAAVLNGGRRTAEPSTSGL